MSVTGRGRANSLVLCGGGQGGESAQDQGQLFLDVTLQGLDSSGRDVLEGKPAVFVGGTPTGGTFHVDPAALCPPVTQPGPSGRLGGAGAPVCFPHPLSLALSLGTGSQALWFEYFSRNFEFGSE